MVEWFGDNAWAAWLIIAALLAISEVAGLDLVLLMFGLGALVAAVAAALGAPLWICLVVFGVASLVMLVFVRPPIVRRLHSGPTLPTAHESLVGRSVVVEERIGAHGGRITIDDLHWSARPQEGTGDIEAGAEVEVVAIDGATAIVARREPA